MSAMELKSHEAWPNKPDWCDITVIYEDVPCREAAMALCHNLAEQFKEDLEFTFSWWNMKYLIAPELARQASHAATRADLIIFSTHSDQDLTPDVKSWIENWLPDRLGREGAITVLTRHSHHPELLSSPLGQHLSEVARKGELDFLSPSVLLAEDAWETIRMREKKVTPVLDEILNRPHVPIAHWGLNE
jgi:hypothetical protein